MGTSLNHSVTLIPPLFNVVAPPVSDPNALDQESMVTYLTMLDDPKPVMKAENRIRTSLDLLAVQSCGQYARAKSTNLKNSLEKTGASFKVVSATRSAGIVVGPLLGSVKVDSPEEIRREIIANPGLVRVDHVSPADISVKWDAAVDSAADRPHLSAAMISMTVTSANYRDIANKLKSLDLNPTGDSADCFNLQILPTLPQSERAIHNLRHGIEQQAALNARRSMVYFTLPKKYHLWGTMEDDERGTTPYLAHLNLYNNVYKRYETEKCPYIVKYGHASGPIYYLCTNHTRLCNRSEGIHQGDSPVHPELHV